jgi:hypothetical protein
MARFRPGDVFDCCATSPATMWLGHLICAPEDGGCGTVYKQALTCFLICPECDRRLIPNDRSPKNPGNQQFTGRAICAHCYRREKATGVAVKVDVLDDPFS